ncbi:2-polyprenyl-6-methoxyphenol hydroxylase [Mesobacillus persicus]|uniref:2-polyprenyl-6-methoxyphenol hydroxylase n=1 Tax=Mesobacillus persicus TaxID=930146 RepID=A0A1H7VMY6_9BACI|nr:FAD-dependent monooxygenase [Mesobacillus persicus]SEM10662.1 2-polyprenyl-6-methoxyphenol hydroxylase [Mesobacillus persicus]
MATGSKSRLGQRAIVIGGGIAGKLAARVLSDYFNEVMVLDKNKESDQTSLRSGVPQGSHGHALLKSGEDILEDLFPGITNELLTSGAIPSNFSKDISWYHHGSWKIKHHSDIQTLQQSRPFLEGHLQRRLEQINNIHFIYGAKVSTILTNPDKTKITGVTYRTNFGVIKEFNADLIIDASGAATQTPKWLKQLGYPQPEKTEVKVDLFYASRAYHTLSPIEKDWKGLLIYPNPPGQARGGGIYKIEDNKWMVTLLGYGIENPPADDHSFLEYAAALDHPTIYQAIDRGKPSSEVSIYRFPSLRRYHYDKLKKFPNGLVVMGDAFCRIDPVFAQGMSLSALEATALKEVLEKATKNRSLNQISQFAHRKFSKLLDIPWMIALTEDFRFNHTTGKRFLGLPFLQSYIKKVVTASATNKDVYETFIHVLHLKAHPVKLFSPKVLKAILFKKVATGTSSAHNDHTIRT